MIRLTHFAAALVAASLVGRALPAAAAISDHDAPWAAAPALDMPPLDAPVLLDHAGQLSPKDDCHRQKSAGERHWHDGDGARGGPCIKEGGETFHLTDHAVCAGPRIDLVREKRRKADVGWVAEALKDCIIGLSPDR